MRRVRRGSTSSELIMCGAGVRSILLLPLVARGNRCMYMAHVLEYMEEAYSRFFYALIDKAPQILLLTSLNLSN